MKASTLQYRALTTLALVGLTVGALTAQALKNRGTIVNTGTATYNSIENFRTGAGGTIINSGTVTSNTTFDNDDGATGLGTVRNFVGGTAAGTIVVTTNLLNDAGSWDNDSLNAFVGRTRVGGSLSSTGTFDTDSGAVDYFGAGAQSVFTTTYGALVASTGGTKTMSGTVIVRDTFRITTGATFATGATGDSLAMLATTLTNGGTFTAALGAVNYGADANQTVFGGTYQRLYLSGSSAARTKTTTSGLAFAASGVLSVGSFDTLAVSGGNLNLATNTPSFTNSSVVKPLADATFHSGISDAGTFYYAGTGAQTVGSVTYTNLLLLNEGVKSFPDEDTVWVNGNYSIVPGAATGSRDYDSTSTVSTLAFTGTGGSQTISGLDGEHMNIVQFEGSSTKSLNGTFVEARKLSLAAGGLVTNNATTLRLSNISGISLSLAASTSLTNSAASTIQMNGDLENDGAITNAGTISVY